MSPPIAFDYSNEETYMLVFEKGIIIDTDNDLFIHVVQWEGKFLN